MPRRMRAVVLAQIPQRKSSFLSSSSGSAPGTVRSSACVFYCCFSCVRWCRRFFSFFLALGAVLWIILGVLPFFFLFFLALSPDDPPTQQAGKQSFESIHFFLWIMHFYRLLYTRSFTIIRFWMFFVSQYDNEWRSSLIYYCHWDHSAVNYGPLGSRCLVRTIGHR